MKAHERIEWLIAYSLAFISAATASLYGFMSAAGPYGLVKGAGLFGVAFIGCHGPAWIVKAKQRLGWLGASFGVLVTGVCLAATLWGGLGTNASGGATLQAERTKASKTIADDRATLAKFERERAAMPAFTAATAETVEAGRSAVAAAERTRLAECGNGDLKQRGPNCRLRETEESTARTVLTTAVGNKAATDQAANLDREAAALRKRLDNAQPAIEADPQASAFSQLTGIPIATSAALNAFWLSLAFELGAMFSMMLAYSNTLAPTVSSSNGAGAVAVDGNPYGSAADATTQLARRPLRIAGVQLIEPPKPAGGDAASVGRFMLACLPRAKGEQATWGAIYVRYERWCAEQEPALSPLDLSSFGELFRATCERVNIRTRKQGTKVYCLDVRLVA